LKKIQKDFNLCKPITSEKDISIFLSDMMGNIQETVQYNGEKNYVLNVTDICNVMLENTKNPYDQFVRLSGLYRLQRNQTCENPSWNDSIAILSNKTKDPNNNMRPWTYQTCNEFGYFQTASSKENPFVNWEKWLDLQFYFDICKEAYNWSSLPMVDWINQIYGDVRIAGTNIIFPSGTIDPWHIFGITNSTKVANPTLKPLYILGTAHCNDLISEANSDPENLKNARKLIGNSIKEWLS